jgi:hypothetical protein
VSEHLQHKLAVLHQSLLHGKLPRNLHWSDAVELISHLGEVQPHGEDEFAFVVGVKREIFRRPRTPELGVEEASRLRTFLKGAGSAAPTAAPAAAPTAAAAAAPHAPARMIVVIDHHVAHVFRDLGGSRPKDEATITPYDPYQFHRHLVHRKEAHYRGDRVPEDPEFYEEVAKALATAGEIVLIGHGTGKSSALDVLVEHLKKHHPDISRRVLATEIADLSALTEPGIEAIAKRHLSVAT